MVRLDRAAKARITYLRPIWPTLKLIISPSRFESPPLGALDRVMVLGSTVFGSCSRSWKRAGWLVLDTHGTGARTHNPPQLSKSSCWLDGQASHAIGSSETQQHGGDVLGSGRSEMELEMLGGVAVLRRAIKDSLLADMQPAGRCPQRLEDGCR